MALGSRPASALAFVGLPILAVVGVGFAFLGVASPHSYAALRLYGGPTEGVPELCWRASVVERLGEIEVPIADEELVIEASLADGRRAFWHGRSDSAGEGAPVVRFPQSDAAVHGAVRVRAWVASRPDVLIAQGEVALTASEWSRTARQRGGWLPVKSQGALDIRVAPGRGAWATSFADPLIVEVSSHGAVASTVELRLHPEGADVSGANVLTTDARGRASVTMTPRESVVTLGIDALAADGKAGHWYATLPVATGALHAELAGEQLVVRSPVVRERAFYAWVDSHHRRAGGAIALAPDGRGGSVGEVRLEPPLRPPAWAVVSSEPELDTASAVGWPLVTNDVEPFQLTFDVADRLLLDGTSIGATRERARTHRASWLGATFGGLCLLLTAAFLVTRARTAEQALRAHLKRQGAETDEVDRSAPPMLAQLIVALLCLALAATALGLWLTYRG